MDLNSSVDVKTQSGSTPCEEQETGWESLYALIRKKEIREVRVIKSQRPPLVIQRAGVDEPNGWNSIPRA